MQFRKLGRSGLDVSVAGLGCNNLGGRIDLEASRAVVHKALDLGITLFDTADMYSDRGGSEIALGKILGARRKDIVLASKFGMAMDEAGRLKGASRRYIMTAVEASLKRLQTDWLDIYQLHRPDAATPMEETLRALDDLVRQGKVRYIGCSNLPAWQVVDAAWIARTGGLERFVSAQDEYSLLRRGAEAELIPALSAHGIGLLPYYPLASGLLTGKYKPDAMPAGARLTKYKSMADRIVSERNWSVLERLHGFCERRGCRMVELAMGWLASRAPVASVIAGATSPAQVEQNVAAVAWRPSAEDLAEIDHLTA